MKKDDVIEIRTPGQELGKVLRLHQDGKRTFIIREWGIEKFTDALDPTLAKVEIVATFPRKVIDLRQINYIMKRRAKHGINTRPNP